MTDQELMLDVGQANELKLAFRRHGWTNEEIKRLCEGTVLGDVRRVIRGEAEIRPIGRSREVPLPDDSLLELVTTVEIPEIRGFTPEDKFKIGVVDGVKIGWLGDNLRNMFLNNGGRVEFNVPASTLRVHRLVRNSLDAPIITALGGEDAAEISLAAVWELLKKQGSGGRGILLTNGYSNIIYVRDATGRLWAVYCRWDADCGFWCVDARSVTRPFRWFAGNRVFSRDSDT